MWAAILTCCPAAAWDQLVFVMINFHHAIVCILKTFICTCSVAHILLASLIIPFHSCPPPVSESELLSENRGGTDSLFLSSGNHLIKKHQVNVEQMPSTSTPHSPSLTSDWDSHLASFWCYIGSTWSSAPCQAAAEV